MSKILKTIVITGASDGIGAYASKILKELGHNVVIVGRNKEKTINVANSLSCPYHIADFSKLEDVKRLANELQSYPKIDVLINNAGAVFDKRIETEDGFEKTFQVNVLSQFLLTNLLMDKLVESKATIIQTTSMATNLFAKNFDINDIQTTKDYSPLKAYAHSKLCNVLFTKELNKRFANKGIKAVAFEPGIPRTNFASEGLWFFKVAYHSPLKYLFTISVKNSSKRMTRLALGEENKDFISGEVYSNKNKYKVKCKDINKKAEIFWAILQDMIK